MTSNLKYKSFLAYSEKNSKCFFTEFGDDVNIIHGKNTSGKSTLFLSILYTFGINDGNQYLKEVLDEKVIFRIDCKLSLDGKTEDLVLIRDEDTLYIKYANRPIKRFNGISANQSVEHIKLKEFLSDIFGFTLQLESKNEYKQAPIETLFLPYYISQSVGWVYLRKSFSSLDYYKNFKEDYLDYYLGLESSVNRVKKHELMQSLKQKVDEINFISKFENNNVEIQLAKLVDEEFVDTSNSYIEKFSKSHVSLIEKENDYVLKCNELGFLQERLSVLKKVSKGHKEQNPKGNCPTCEQILPIGISEIYKYLQEENDTEQEVTTIKAKIKDVQSKVNSLQNSISEERKGIEKDYVILNRYRNSNISYETWLKTKANTQLMRNLDQKLGELTIERSGIQEELKKYKTEKEVEEERERQSNEFEAVFMSFTNQLGIKKLEEQRYTRLYQISSFPYQGVELHKTIMAYHFAFNRIISGTDGIHRLPFMLDAVFKEDIEDANKRTILQFISKNRPKDTQLIFSVAQIKDQPSNAAKYNADFFSDAAKLIQIGEGDLERAFLMPYPDAPPFYILETNNMIAGESDDTINQDKEIIL